MRPVTKDEFEGRILYERDGLLVFNKPYDLPSSGRSLTDPDCLQSLLIERHGAMVWAVHQLDADTTGLNLFVTEKSRVQDFKARMAWPHCEKSYLAVLHGSPSKDQFSVDAPIGPSPDSHFRSLGITDTGRVAISHFQILARSPMHCLVRVTIETGRTHQIRIHAAHAGHPLVGEEWYRDPPCTLHPRQALHAHRMQFSDRDHPSDLEAPIPNDLLALCKRLELQSPILTTPYTTRVRST